VVVDVAVVDANEVDGVAVVVVDVAIVDAVADVDAVKWVDDEFNHCSNSWNNCVGLDTMLGLETLTGLSF
jgi:hypothetical protein